jgi:hypothetical protein
MKIVNISQKEYFFLGGKKLILNGLFYFYFFKKKEKDMQLKYMFKNFMRTILKHGRATALSSLGTI